MEGKSVRIRLIRDIRVPSFFDDSVLLRLVVAWYSNWRRKLS
jgi:hypothetical protein